MLLGMEEDVVVGGDDDRLLVAPAADATGGGCCCGDPEALLLGRSVMPEGLPPGPAEVDLVHGPGLDPAVELVHL